MKKEILYLNHASLCSFGAGKIHHLDLTVFEGEILCLHARSFPEYKTLYDFLHGRCDLEDGAVFYDGKPVSSLRPHIHIVDKKSGIIGGMTVAENLFLSEKVFHRYGAVDYRSINLLASRILKEAGLSHIDPGRKAALLSREESLLIEMLKTVSMKKRILVLEKSDFYENSRLIPLLRKLRDKNITVIYITDNMDDVFDEIDRLCIIRQGTAVVCLEWNSQNRAKIYQELQISDITETKAITEIPPGMVLGVIAERNGYGEEIKNLILDGKITIPALAEKVTDEKRIVCLHSSLINKVVFENLNLVDNVAFHLPRELVKRRGVFDEKNRRIITRVLFEKLDLGEEYEELVRRKRLIKVNNSTILAVWTARVIAQRPQVLIFEQFQNVLNDEETGYLRNLLVRLSREGIACVVVSQSKIHLQKVADFITLKYEKGQTPVNTLKR